MGKGACIKRMVAVRNYSTNTIMEKNKTRGKGGGGRRGRVKDMKCSGVLLKDYSGIAHSVLISLGHF